jgi:hypothetical protein
VEGKFALRLRRRLSCKISTSEELSRTPADLCGQFAQGFGQTAAALR